MVKLYVLSNGLNYVCIESEQIKTVPNLILKPYFEEINQAKGPTWEIYED